MGKNSCALPERSAAIMGTTGPSMDSLSQHLKGKTRAELADSRLLQLGVVRLVEIVGEAGARVSKEERAKHPQIPWDDVVGMRNRLIHGYDTVDLDILWDTVKDDLPRLIATLERVVPPDLPPRRHARRPARPDPGCEMGGRPVGKRHDHLYG